jgi:hypothetical protein
VTGLPQPSSRTGGSRQEMPVRNWSTMPANTARSSTWGRPPERRGGGATAAGSFAGAARGPGRQRRSSWPRTIPTTSVSNRNRPKVGNMLSLHRMPALTGWPRATATQAPLEGAGSSRALQPPASNRSRLAGAMPGLDSGCGAGQAGRR